MHKFGIEMLACGGWVHVVIILDISFTKMHIKSVASCPYTYSFFFFLIQNASRRNLTVLGLTANSVVPI